MFDCSDFLVFGNIVVLLKFCLENLPISTAYQSPTFGEFEHFEHYNEETLLGTIPAHQMLFEMALNLALAI